MQINDCKVLINRFKKDSKETLSTVIVMIGGAEVFRCVGLELPWMNNQHGISCVIAGAYKGRKTGATANLPYPHIAIDGVKDRDGICMHIVNYVRQLRGCVGLGDKHVDIDGDGTMDVSNSKITFDKFFAIIPDNFDIIISETNE